MKKLILLLLLLAIPCVALGSGFQGFPQVTAPTQDDILLIEDDPAGTPATSYMALEDFIAGKSLAPITETTAATLDLATSDACAVHLYLNGDNDAIDYTLPPAAANLVCCFGAATYAQVVTVDPDDGVDYIIIEGVANSAGNAIDSTGVIGEYICLVALDGTRWLSLGFSGTWTDGGVD